MGHQRNVTAKAAADRVEGVLTEDVVPSPVGPYGESKIKAEEYVLNALTEKPEAFEDKGIYMIFVRA